MANCHPDKGNGLKSQQERFKDAVHLRYDWQASDVPNVCVCGEPFNVDHAMICKRGGFIIQRHIELRDLEAQMLNLVCHDVEIKPVVQEITGESLVRGANTAPDDRLDIHARGCWSRQGSTIFDIRVCHPNAESYKDLSPQQIYRQRENERNVCTQAELWRWNKPRSRRWFSPLQVAWHPNVKSITSD